MSESELTKNKVNLKITGRVQGVFYRQSMREAAQALGLSGWVRNAPDGSVEAEVSGPRERLEQIIAWARKGPPHARVDDVVAHWDETATTGETYKGAFEIRH